MATSIIKPKAEITTNTLAGQDLNDIKTNFMGYVGNSTNGPSGITSNGNLISNFAPSGTRGYQIFRPYNSMRLFTRAYNLNSDNAWRDWIEITQQYPKVYHGLGWLISGQNLQIKGYGSGTITLYETGIARIDFVQTITTTDTATANFNWGIDSGFFNTFFGTTLPTITPLNGFSGSATYYKSDGTINPDATQNGGLFEKHLTYWTPARTYNTVSKGGWPTSMFPVGSKIVGTCYGTFTV